MWRLLAAIRRNFRRSGRVADEGAFGGGGGGGGIGLNREVVLGVTGQRSPTRGCLVRGGLAIVYGVIRVPNSLLSCVSHPNVVDGGLDGAWASGRDFVNLSEMNHLVVDDGMRYAMFM